MSGSRREPRPPARTIASTSRYTRPPPLTAPVLGVHHPDGSRPLRSSYPFCSGFDLQANNEVARAVALSYNGKPDPPPMASVFRVASSYLASTLPEEFDMPMIDQPASGPDLTPPRVHLPGAPVAHGPGPDRGPGGAPALRQRRAADHRRLVQGACTRSARTWPTTRSRTSSFRSPSNRCTAGSTCRPCSRRSTSTGWRPE